MISLNPYTYIGGAALAAAVAGTFYYQSLQIHHYHVLYDNSQVQVGVLTNQITGMTTAQNDQIKKSDDNVIKVVQIPEKVQPIINEIKTAPSSGNCTPPNYSDEVKNAF